MTHLMHQCKYIIQRVVVVEKHVRMNVIYTAGVGTAALSFALDHIDPSVVVSGFYNLKIVISQRLKSL